MRTKLLNLETLFYIFLHFVGTLDVLNLRLKISIQSRHVVGPRGVGGGVGTGKYGLIKNIYFHLFRGKKNTSPGRGPSGRRGRGLWIMRINKKKNISVYLGLKKYSPQAGALRKMGGGGLLKTWIDKNISLIYFEVKIFPFPPGPLEGGGREESFRTIRIYIKYLFSFI